MKDPKKPVPSYRDIAEAAGVSQMAVSLAMRDHQGVSRSTRDRVLRIAEQLGYRPDPRMSEMMGYLRKRRERKDKPVLALLNPHDDSAFIEKSMFARRIVEGAVDRAEELGFALQTFWLQAPGMSARRISSILEHRGIRGLLLMPFLYSVEELDLSWDMFTAVATSYTASSIGVNQVCKDSHQMFNLAMSRLRAKGYQRIGLATTFSLSERADHHHMAFNFWSQSRLPAAFQVKPLCQETIVRDDLAKWLKEERPQVVLSPINSLYDELSAIGLKLPGDIGFASLSTFENEVRRLTGVDERPDRIGRAAIDMLTSQVSRNEKGLPAYKKQTLIEGTWIAGETA